MWGCKTHWFKLPKHIRDEIWRTFRPGQEKNWTPSAAYIAAAQTAQNWIAANSPNEKGQRSAFDAWWHNEGSGMPPMTGEDAATHVRRICEIAWNNGTYKANAENLE